MARAPHEFGVPSFELQPENEPLGYVQTGYYPAGTINIIRQQDQMSARSAASQRVVDEAHQAVAMNAQWDQDFPFGSVTKPEQETLRGYKYILRQGGGVRDIQFAPRIYGIFDGIIAKEGGVDRDSRKYTAAPFDSDHPHYDEYAALRRNIAILRNYLLVTMLPQGNADSANYTAIQQMATQLGKALNNKPPFLKRWVTSVKRMLTGQDMSIPQTNPFLEAANVPDRGIAVMYDYLFNRRDTPVSLFSHPVDFILSKPWNLLNREDTPFSEMNLLLYSRATTMVGIADAFEGIVGQLQSIDTLTESDRRISVEHARNILDNLRIIMGSAREEASVDVIEDTKQAEAKLMLRAAMAFKDAMAGLAKVDPALLHDPLFADANDALSQIDYLMKVEAREALKAEGRMPEANAMGKRIAAMPKRSNPQPIGTLIAKLKTGLTEASKVSQSAVTRPSVPQPAKTKTKLTPAQQAVQSTSHTFGYGGKVKQVSNASILPGAEKINEHALEQERKRTQSIGIKRDDLSGPAAPGRK